MPRLVLYPTDSDSLAGLKEQPQDPVTAVASWRSRFPTAGKVSNLVALAALTSWNEYDDRDDAVKHGWPEPTADAYFRPNGILLRMRLICFGVENRGQPFRTPQDKAWWQSKYKFGANLWDVLGTLAKITVRTATSSPTFPSGPIAEDPFSDSWALDSDLLKGDEGEIAQAHLAIVRDDLGPFQASKCEPPYLIPTFGGITPIANPKCKAADIIKPVVDKIGDIFGVPWWIWVLLGIAITKEDRR